MANQSCWKCGKDGNLGLSINGVELLNKHTMSHIKELINMYKEGETRQFKNDYLIICPEFEHPQQPRELQQ